MSKKYGLQYQLPNSSYYLKCFCHFQRRINFVHWNVSWTSIDLTLGLYQGKRGKKSALEIGQTTFLKNSTELHTRVIYWRELTRKLVKEREIQFVYFYSLLSKALKNKMVLNCSLFYMYRIRAIRNHSQIVIIHKARILRKTFLEFKEWIKIYKPHFIMPQVW